MSDNDWGIVPERDEDLINARKGKPTDPRKVQGGKPANGKAAAPRSNKVRESGAGDSLALWSFVFLLVFASLGANVYLYLRLTDMSADSLSMDTRVLDLESKLDVTDESFSESAAALRSTLQTHGSELELHMSEIRKLWAIYQRWDPAITELQRSLEQANQRLTALNAVPNRLTTAEQRLEAAASQGLVLAAEVESVSAAMREVRDAINAQRTAMQQVQRLQQEQAQAIDAIDAFRLQMNQRVLRLESPTP